MKKILIAQSQLRNYSGSEIVTIELAEYFSKKLGWEVTILTHYLGVPISRDIETLGVDIILSNSERATQLRMDSYDLVWVHHYTFTPELIDGFKEKSRSTKIVFNHMSFTEPFEAIQYPYFEKKAADFIVFNSHATKDKFLEATGYRDDSKLIVLDNSAPEEFHVASDNSSALRRIAVVSNHPPRELVEAGYILKNNNIETVFIGRTKNGASERVTPQLLSTFDVVITIGKTVQYSIALGKPVYCYDSSGGPGYLDKNNYELTHYRNFSGRGYGKKSPEDIAREITHNYTQAVESIKKIHDDHAQDFLLSDKLNLIISGDDRAAEVFDDLELYPIRKQAELYKQIIPGYASYLHHARHLTEYELENAKHLIHERKQFGLENKELTKQKKLLTSELERYKAYEKYKKIYYETINSRSYRVGRVVLAPLRFVKNITRWKV